MNFIAKIVHSIFISLIIIKTICFFLIDNQNMFVEL